VVWASSSSVYGDAPERPCGEGAPTRPRSPYGVTKLACEGLAAIARAGGLSVTGLRYFTVYGPRQRPDMALRRICEALAGGPAFPLLGDGGQSRDVTHVADAAEATVRAATAAEVAEVYNVGGGQEASLAELMAELAALAGRPVPVLRRDPAPGDVRHTAADTSRIRRDLGWRPRVRLREGLAGELAWVRARAGRFAPVHRVAAGGPAPPPAREAALGR
jgi:nucleoside-diphosphate-sugar epimerase